MIPRRLTLVLALLCGCRKAESHAGHAGTLEAIWSLRDTSDVKGLFGTLERFQVASNGRDRIVVLSRQDHQVLLLDLLGHVIDSLGRQGRGPGELANPYAINIDTEGNLNVIDLGQRQIVRWDSAGALLPPIPLTESLDHPQVLVSHRGIRYVTWSVTENRSKEFRLVERDSAGTRILSTTPRETRVADFPSCQAARITSAPLFSQGIAWDAKGDRVAVGVGLGYRIDLFERGVPVGTVQRPIEPSPATEALALAEAADWMINGCVVKPSEVVQGLGYLPLIPVVRAVALSPAGAVWVLRRGVDGTPDLVDRFAADMGYVGTLPAGSPFPAAFLDESRFLAVEKDSLDRPALTLYRVHSP